MLKGSWGIGKPKWHDQELIMSTMSLEGSFVDILLMHSELVIARPKINLAKYHSTRQFIHQFIKNRNGVLVLDSLIIKLPVIYAKSPCAILLSH